MRTVAEFRIQYRQRLDARGEVTDALPAFAHDPPQVLQMYRLMTLLPRFDTRAVNLQRTRRLGPYPNGSGRRFAAPAGSARTPWSSPARSRPACACHCR